MNKVKEYFSKNKFIYIIFIFTILVLILPSIHKDLSIGDDYVYHMARIQSLADSIRHGVFPVKINSTLANSFGYASSMFYPDFLLYIPSFIMVIFNADAILAYKIFVFLFLCFTFLVFYKCFYYITKNKNSAIFGTIFLLLSRIVFLSLHYRFAVGEFLGFTFILPAVIGMYDYVYNDFKSPYFLIIGFLGLINTHLITGLIVLCFCIIFFIVNIKTSIKNPKKVLKLLGCTILVLLISSFFWLPMIEQIKAQTLRLAYPWSDIKDDDYALYDYFGKGTYSIGYSVFLSLPIMLYALFYKKFDKDGKMYFFYFVILSLILVCPWLWEKFSSQLNIIQFRWRLLGINTTVYAISIALLFNNNIKDISTEKIEKIIVFILIILTLFMIGGYYNDHMNRRISMKDLYEKIYEHPHSLRRRM